MRLLESEGNPEIDNLKGNVNYCIKNANSIFDNLNLSCEWDSVSNLIHILVRFNDPSAVGRIKDISDLYSYPLDITIPYESESVVIYNSKRSITEPDIRTQTNGDDIFNYEFFTSYDHQLLCNVLVENLIELDEALS